MRTFILAITSLGFPLIFPATPMSAAAPETLDQAQEVTGDNVAFYQPKGCPSAGVKGAAQTFTAGLSGPLTRVDLYLAKTSWTTDAQVVRIEIRAGDPSGALLAISNVSAASIPFEPAFAWVSFTFAAPATLTAGQVYAIVLPPDLLSNDSFDPTYRWPGPHEDIYSGGVTWDLYRCDVLDWQPYVFGSDRTFRTYMNVLGPGCSVPMSFDLDPGTLNLRSMGRWMTATLEPESSDSPSDIDVSSILLNGTVPVDVSAPTSIGDRDHDGRPDLTVRFERAAVQATVTEGAAMTFSVTGQIGSDCFEATDVIRVIRGNVRATNEGEILSTRSQTAARLDPATAVGAGAKIGFGLRGANPNPSRGSLRVDFSLPTAHPTTLAVFDLAGRRVIAREVGGLGSGRHTIELGGRTLPAGVYVIQLSQGGRTIAMRATLIH